jgi:hypothetical protein
LYFKNHCAGEKLAQISGVGRWVPGEEMLRMYLNLNPCHLMGLWEESDGGDTILLKGT